MSETTRLLAAVKEAGEDFEWYPTTREMLEVVAADIRSEMDRDSFALLDIGAGNGSALQTLCELTGSTGEKYAIEKSRMLVDALPKDVFVIGTDFYQQTLIDKEVDVIFCNPPYSDFETWMRRIVAEANCQLIYLVVPQRWQDNGFVMDLINRRCSLGEPEITDDDEDVRRAYRRERGICQVLASMTFEDSEHRRARAKIDILKIKLKPEGYSRTGRSDPFDMWFENTFKINADKTDHESKFATEEASAKKLHELVTGQNLIERLEELYRADFDKLLGTYRDLEKLDRDLFKELGVNLPAVREALKLKIKGLKNLYWKELFDNLDSITTRLTSKSRASLLGKLTAHTSIDFTADNAYAVVVWAIKNANAYFDSQLLEVYLELADQENIRNYKSNKRIVTDEWRYLSERERRARTTHFALDYRLVLNRWQCFSPSSFSNYGFPNGLHEGVHALLNDLCTIAQNLGIHVSHNSMSFYWSPGMLYEFRLADGQLFMDVRAFKKGTIHVRLNQDFMRRLNVEAGRLNGWIKSPAEAREEMEIENAEELFGNNFKLTSIPLLSAAD